MAVSKKLELRLLPFKLKHQVVFRNTLPLHNRPKRLEMKRNQKFKKKQKKKKLICSKDIMCL